MSGEAIPRTSSCPKCSGQNPVDAVFCGFCGASLRERKAPAPEKATLFGYVADGVLHAGAMPPAAAATVAVAPPTPSRAALAPGPGPGAARGVSDPVPLLAGRYRLGASLGRLPVGELRSAVDASGGAAVTMLLLNPAVIASALELERARRELRQLQKAEGPQLLRVIDHGRSADDGYFIAIEPLQGTSLADLVARGPLSLAVAARVAGEVAEALAAVQKVGVVHRDVAPENVWLLPDGSAQVLCCSVAAPIAGEIHGTAAFISPEQASGRPVDQRSNIYSLGALLYFMLAGEPPFVGDPVALLRQHQEDEPPTLRQRRPDLDLPARVDALVSKAMSKVPSRRHLTLRQLLRELEAVVVPPVSAELPPPASAQPMTTPVHGVTSLTGGARPPSSEWAAARQPTAAPTRPPAAQVTAAAAPAGPPVAMTSAGSLLGVETSPVPVVAGASTSASTTSAPGAGIAALSPGAAVVAPTMISQVDPGSSLPVPARTQQAPAPRPSTSAPAAPVAKPSAAVAGGKAPAGEAAAGGQGAFRETMWFFRGEVESAMAEQGAAPEAALPDPQQLAEKYTDATDLSDETAQRLSLRTGKTQMMQRPAVPPSGAVPGAPMDVEDLVGEFNQGRKIGIALGVALAVAALAAILWFVLR